MIAGGKAGRLTTEPTTPRPDIDGIVEKLPVISDRPARTAVVDSEYVPASNILAHVEGSNWRTKAYYRQILGLNEEARPQQLGTSSVHQQYERIEGMVLKVVTPLSQSQDEDTKEFQVTGEGGIYYGLVPNFGDMFIADVGDGRDGLFTIIRTTRMTFSKAACYEAGWQLVDFLTPEREADLEAKTGDRRLVFDISQVEMLDTPFLTEAQSVTYQSLDDYTTVLQRVMKERFWATRVQNYSVPDLGDLTFDGYHIDYLRYIDLSDDRHPVTVYQNGRLKYEDVMTLWSLLKNQSNEMQPYICGKFGLVQTYMLRNASVFRGIGYTQFNLTVYPQENLMEKDETTPGYSACRMFKSTVNPPAIPTRDGTPLYAPVDADEYYVFTKAFYTSDKPSMSVLERITTDMLSDGPVNPEDVQALCREVANMRRIDQFYLIPIILTLIKYCKRGYAWRP